MSVTFIVRQFSPIPVACLQLTSDNALYIKHVFSNNNLEIM